MMKRAYQWLISEESGQGMVEYALILAGIALLVVGAVLAVGHVVNNSYLNDIDIINNAVN